MKTLSLQIDDHLYDALITLLKQLPENKVYIVEEQSLIKDVKQVNFSHKSSRLGGMVGTGKILENIIEPAENLDAWTVLK